MGSEQFRQTLFRKHLADLQGLRPGIQDLFVCPICLGKFSTDDLETGNLTDGHVWPKGIRRKSYSEVAAKQRVLLCHRCNSMMGTRGDRQMQLREKIKEGEETGQMYGERRIQIHHSFDEEPIELRAQVDRIPGKAKAQLGFNLDADRRCWSRNDPKEQERFFELVNSDRRCNIVIHPHSELNHRLVKVGWIAAAYNFAFYTLGYRYILNRSLCPVRNYILSSFGNINREELKLPTSMTLSLTECTEHYYTDPEIELFVPLDGESFVYLQVNFLDYHVRLPMHFAQIILRELIHSQSDITTVLPDIVGKKGASLSFRIDCNKFDDHPCIWDYVLGKPIELN